MASDRDTPRQVTQQLKQRAPPAHRVLRIGGVAAGIITILLAGGAAFVAFLLASPLLLLFSPILVPLAIVAALAFGAFVAFVAFVSAVTWMYKYAKGGHPVGSHQVDAAKNRIVETATQVTEKAREVVNNVSAA